MELANASGYLSDGETTADSINLPHLEGHQWSQLEDGTIEVTDHLPKKEYYLSLRRLSNNASNAETLHRLESVSSSALGTAANGSPPMAGAATLTGTTPRSLAGTLRGRSTTPGSKFKPSGKTVDCTVIMLDGTPREFRLDQAVYGQQLFESVCNHLGLLEVEYFGITYYDSTRTWYWLKMHKKIAKQLKSNNWQFEFQVKFYPYDIDSIKEDITRYYLCLQVRQDLVSGQLPCSFMTYCMLAAYVVQSEAGDHDPSQHVDCKYIEDHPFAPHSLQSREMLEQIVKLHKLHRGKTPEEADRLFLHNARILALYGVDLHKVKNAQGEDVNLGVHHGGIVLYRNRVRLMRIPWPRMVVLSYRRRNFLLTLRPIQGERANQVLSFRCANVKAAKRLFTTCVEHHTFFRLRTASKKPIRPSFLPSFATRKYHYRASMVRSPQGTGVPGIGNGPSRPLSVFRPIPTHPGDPYGRMNGYDPSQYQHQHFTHGNHPQALEAPYYNGEQNVSFGPTQSMGAPDARRGVNENYAPTLSSRPVFEAEPWKSSLADRTAGLGIDAGGLDVAAQRGSGWQGCRANKGVNTPGAYYFETTCLEDGLVRVGWSTNEASLELGTDNCGFGFGSDAVGAAGAAGTGRAMHRNAGHDYGITVHKDDVIGCMLDLIKGSVSWSCNGREFPRCFTIPDPLRGEAFFPAASLKDSRILFNFGDQPMAFPPGGPFVPVAHAPEDSLVPNRNTGWRLNQFDASTGIDVAPDGSMVQAHFARGWQGCRANQGVCGRGRYYFEVSPLEETGLCRVGWSTEEGNLDLGSDQHGYGYGADNAGFGLNGQQGKRMHNNEIDNYGEAFTKGDVIGCFLDTIERTVKWSKNGVDFGTAYQIPSDVPDSNGLLPVFFPTVSLLNSTVEFNFGYQSFRFYPGPDWTPVCFAPVNQLKRARRKGPERKIKGWSYIDPAALEPALRQDLRSAVASRAVDRRDEAARAKADSLFSYPPSASSPTTTGARHLPVGGVPMPGMVGQSLSPIHPIDREHLKHNGLNGHSTAALDETTSPSATSARFSLNQSTSPDSPSTNGQSTKGAAPVFGLRDSSRLLSNGEVVSVQRSKPQVQTESYVNEQGKLIKRTIQRSEVTTTKSIVRRIVTDGSGVPVETDQPWVADEFDEALNLALLNVTGLDGDVSVVRGTVDQVEFHAPAEVPSGWK